MTSRRAVRILTGLWLVASLAACGADDSARQSPASGAPSTGASGSTGTTDATATGFPLTVQNCGRTLTFTAPPTRAVTGYQPVLETVLALGVGDAVIGRLNYSENGPDGFLPGQKALYDKIPEISPKISLPNREALLSLEPDLVLEYSYSGFNASKGQATIDELIAAGSQVFIAGGWCDAQGVKDYQISDSIEDVRTLGKIFGVPERGEELAAELQATVDEVATKVKDRPKVKVLATDGGAGPVNAYGGGGVTARLIEAAGGTNVLGDVDEDYFQASKETVSVTEPDAVLVSDYQPGDTGQQKADQAFALVPDSPAAKTERFDALPVAGQHPGYRNVLTLRRVAQFLHPDAF